VLPGVVEIQEIKLGSKIGGRVKSVEALKELCGEGPASGNLRCSEWKHKGSTEHAASSQFDLQKLEGGTTRREGGGSQGGRGRARAYKRVKAVRASRDPASAQRPEE